MGHAGHGRSGAVARQTTEEAPVSRTRQIIVVIVLAFVVYAVVNSPQQSANVVNDAWGSIKHGLHSVGTFFNTLINS